MLQEDAGDAQFVEEEKEAAQAVSGAELKICEGGGNRERLR